MYISKRYTLKMEIIMKVLINEDQILNPDLDGLTEEERQMLNKKKVITEYVETGEGRGISIRSINEKKIKNIDGQEVLIENEV